MTDEATKTKKTRRSKRYNKRDLDLARHQSARTAYDTVLILMEASEQNGKPFDLKGFVKEAVAANERLIDRLLQGN